jgi:hypothetical protein
VIYTYGKSRRHVYSADKLAEHAGAKFADNVETTGSVESEKSELSGCFYGSAGGSDDTEATRLKFEDFSSCDLKSLIALFRTGSDPWGKAGTIAAR